MLLYMYINPYQNVRVSGGGFDPPTSNIVIYTTPLHLRANEYAHTFRLQTKPNQNPFNLLQNRTCQIQGVRTKVVLHISGDLEGTKAKYRQAYTRLTRNFELNTMVKSFFSFESLFLSSCM